jgi:hypothetical protein
MRAFSLATIVVLGLTAPLAATATAAAADLQTAEAANAKLADFRGPWVGSTGPNADIVRNATILIELHKGGGFKITWTSFEAVEDKPAAPVNERKGSMTFEPTKRAGLWRAAGANDPVAGRAGWATIKGQTLLIGIIAVLPDGRLEQQIYDRTLTAGGMKLVYRRLVDGRETKTIEAQFLKNVMHQ